MAITYLEVPGSSKVMLDGKHVGTIKRNTRGWKYFPKGAAKLGGVPYPTLALCKQSLEIVSGY